MPNSSLLAAILMSAFALIALNCVKESALDEAQSRLDELYEAGKEAAMHLLRLYDEHPGLWKLFDLLLEQVLPPKIEIKPEIQAPFDFIVSKMVEDCPKHEDIECSTDVVELLLSILMFIVAFAASTSVFFMLKKCRQIIASVKKIHEEDVKEFRKFIASRKIFRENQANEFEQRIEAMKKTIQELEIDLLMKDVPDDDSSCSNDDDDSSSVSSRDIALIKKCLQNRSSDDDEGSD